MCVWGGEGRLTKEITCIYAQPLDTDNSAMKACGVVEARWRGDKGEKGGASVILSTIKNNLKNALGKKSTPKM